MKYVVILSSLLIFSGIFAQKVSVSYLFTVPSDAVSSSFFKKPHTLASRQFLAMELMQASLCLTELGYYTATLDVDSLTAAPNIMVKVFPGDQFNGVQLTLSPELVPWFEQYARSAVRVADAVVFKSPSAYASALQQVIRAFQNNGYLSLIHI